MQKHGGARFLIFSITQMCQFMTDINQLTKV